MVPRKRFPDIRQMAARRRGVGVGQSGGAYVDMHSIGQTMSDKLSIVNRKRQQVAKYRQLTNSHIFVPAAIESAGTWNHQAVELVQELGRRITAVTEERQLTCSSGCQWLYSGVMPSPSTALSPPTKRRCGLLA